MNANNLVFNDFSGVHDDNSVKGLTKREYFAAMAMQGLLEKRTAVVNEFKDVYPAKTYAEAACNIADALLKELNKQP